MFSLLLVIKLLIGVCTCLNFLIMSCWTTCNAICQYFAWERTDIINWMVWGYELTIRLSESSITAVLTAKWFRNIHVSIFVRPVGIFGQLCTMDRSFFAAAAAGDGSAISSYQARVLEAEALSDEAAAAEALSDEAAVWFWSIHDWSECLLNLSIWVRLFAACYIVSLLLHSYLMLCLPFHSLLPC